MASVMGTTTVLCSSEGAQVIHGQPKPTKAKTTNKLIDILDHILKFNIWFICVLVGCVLFPK